MDKLQQDIDDSNIELEAKIVTSSAQQNVTVDMSGERVANATPRSSAGGGGLTQEQLEKIFRMQKEVKQIMQNFDKIK